jgi:2-polyprenyl-6-methoxyphenol hydroxylase-like FAD-dependent oxidoreductase
LDRRGTHGRRTLGQGAWLSVEDAVVLAAALERGDIDEALRTYDAARRPRTQSLVRTSGTLALILRIRNPAAARLRDTLIRTLPTPLFGRFAAGAFSWAPPTSGPGR